MFDTQWMMLIGGSTALAASALLTPLVIRLAHRLDWLAYPKADRWHSRPTALMGGIGIFAGAVAGLVAAAPSILPWEILVGAAIMFATGFVDDRRGLSPVAKLIAQVAAAGCLLYAGYRFAPGWPIWISIPLTFLWMIGITNAVNLLDNMDGLAAGVAATAAAALGVFCWGMGDLANGSSALIVAGAALGFLIYNFNPARIFMGDCGSLFLGYAVAAMAVICQSGTPNPEGVSAYLVSAAVLSVPIFDTTLVTVMRKMNGRRVSQGGRDHSSHRLVFAGLSERQAVLTLYGVSAASGLLAILFAEASVQLFYAASIYMAIGMLVFGIYLARADVYAGAEAWRPEHRVFVLLHAFFGRRWKVVFGVVADLLLVTAAFMLAYHLRFEDGLTPQREAFLLGILPILVVVKLVAFVAGGLYNAIWRHAGTPEIVRIVKTTTIASAAAFVVLGIYTGFAGLSKGVFLIDWMIVTISVTGLRFGFRALRQYVASKRARGRRVLLYGAGEAGLMAVREMRSNRTLERVPVAFLDDDPRKLGMAIQGISVQGAFEQLEQVCLRERVDEVVLTTGSIPDRRMIEIADRCAAVDVSCTVFQLQLLSVRGNEGLRTAGDATESGGDGATKSSGASLTPGFLRPGA